MTISANLNPESKTVPSYEGCRPDILRHITRASRVLDVGCNRGAVVQDLKNRFSGCRCWGIEINAEALKYAEPLLERGFSLDLDKTAELKKSLDDLLFDTIIAGDVLEHTWDPWTIVSVLFDHLTPGGSIFVSLPNVAHWSLLTSWLRQSWPLRPRGIFDNTHRRFFMRRDLERLAPRDAVFTLLSRNFRLLEVRQSRADALVRVALKRIPWLREYLTFQYIFSISKRDETS